MPAHITSIKPVSFEHLPGVRLSALLIMISRSALCIVRALRCARCSIGGRYKKLHFAEKVAAIVTLLVDSAKVS